MGGGSCGCGALHHASKACESKKGLWKAYEETWGCLKVTVGGSVAELQVLKASGSLGIEGIQLREPGKGAEDFSEPSRAGKGAEKCSNPPLLRG